MRDYTRGESKSIRVFGQKDHTHATAPELLCDFVVGNGLVDHGLVGRHQAFEFFKPVEDDVDLGRC